MGQHAQAIETPMFSASKPLSVKAIRSKLPASKIAELIEAHKATYSAMEKASIEMDEASMRLSREDPIYIGPFKHGWSMKMGEDVVIAELSKAFQKQRERCGTISAINPDLGTQVSRELDECEVKALADVKRAFNELEDKYHVRETDHAWHVAEETEGQALLAVCSYRCQTPDDYRAKAEYLSGWEVRQSMDDEHYAALLLSMTGKEVE